MRPQRGDELKFVREVPRLDGVNALHATRPKPESCNKGVGVDARKGNAHRRVVESLVSGT